MQATSTLGSPQLPNRSSFDYQFISQIPRQLQTQFSQSPGLQAPRQPFLYIAGLGGVLAPIPANTQPNSQGITSQPASTITIQAEITSMLFNDANGIIAYVVGPQLGGDLKVALADFVYSNQQCLSQIDNSSLTSTWSNIQSSILQTAPSFTNWDLFQTPYGCAYDSGYIFTALTNAEYLAHFAPSDLLDFGHHYAMATLSELEMALNTCYLTNFSVFTNNEVSMRAELLTANLLLQASLLANDYQTAISTIQRLETVAPVNASTYWALANLYFQLAETDFGTPESVVSYKHAIQKLVYLVGTDDTNAMWTLASCYESLANSYLYIPNRPAAIQCAKMAADTWWNLWLQTSNGMAAFNSFQERDYASGVLPVKANLPFVRGSVHELPRLDKRLSVKILE
jgi:tetratricopeptide (TPR) repeat protein